MGFSCPFRDMAALIRYYRSVQLDGRSVWHLRLSARRSHVSVLADMLFDSTCASSRISLHGCGALHRNLDETFAFMAKIRFRHAKNHLIFSSVPWTAWVLGPHVLENRTCTVRDQACCLLSLRHCWQLCLNCPSQNFQALWGKTAGM